MAIIRIGTGIRKGQIRCIMQKRCKFLYIFNIWVDIATYNPEDEDDQIVAHGVLTKLQARGDIIIQEFNKLI